MIQSSKRLLFYNYLMNNLSQVFNTANPLIGALHFPPLLGFEGFTSFEQILDFSLNNAKILEQAGFDGIIVENNYDLPHAIKVGPETVAAMTYLTEKIIKAISIPVGVSMLWNSFEAGLSVAKVTGAKFIRVPVFVDQVETSYGVVEGEPEATISFRGKIDGHDILLFTDIQVKHSKLLNVRPIGEAAKEAVAKGSDGIIVTGKLTGDAPILSDLEQTRQAVGDDFPIIIGSGATKDNINQLLKYANGVIVGTAIKSEPPKSKEEHVNLLGPYVPIDLEKALEFAREYAKTC